MGYSTLIVWKQWNIPHNFWCQGKLYGIPHNFIPYNFSGSHFEATFQDRDEVTSFDHSLLLAFGHSY